LGIALLHFNKASKAGQSQTYTVGLPTITLTHPNSGETWHVGDVVTITWTSTNLPEDTSITVYILSSNGMDESITGSEGVPNTGSYKWTVPNSVAGNSIIGTHERIDTMITGANPYSPGDGSAYSPVFTIAE
jgi:FtsP/CotA-like multicopper oxidase with cupredoxin domain